MARSRRSSPTSSSARKAAPAPAKTTPAHTPAAQSAPRSGGGMMGGLLGTVADGMAWGTGTAIARTAVNSVVDTFSGGSKEATSAPAAAAPVATASAPASQANVCVSDQKAFLDCVNLNKNDISSCQFYMDALNQCKQQSAYL